MKPMKTIKDGWNKFTVVVKDKDYSTREAVLFAICTFLTGLVLGMLCSLEEPDIWLIQRKLQRWRLWL